MYVSKSGNRNLELKNNFWRNENFFCQFFATAARQEDDGLASRRKFFRSGESCKNFLKPPTYIKNIELVAELQLLHCEKWPKQEIGRSKGGDAFVLNVMSR